MEYLYNKDQIKRHLIRIENYSSTFDSRIFSSRYFFQFGVFFLEQGRVIFRRVIFFSFSVVNDVSSMLNGTFRVITCTRSCKGSGENSRGERLCNMGQETGMMS